MPIFKPKTDEENQDFINIDPVPYVEPPKGENTVSTNPATFKNILGSFKEGGMERLRSISYAETNTEAPYVTKDIPRTGDTKKYEGLFSEMVGETALFASQKADDVSRLTKLLLDKGETITSREVLLATIPRIAAGQFAEAALGGLNALTVAPYLLAQGAVEGTGVHLPHSSHIGGTYIKSGGTLGKIFSFLGFGGGNIKQNDGPGWKPPVDEKLISKVTEIKPRVKDEETPNHIYSPGNPYTQGGQTSLEAVKTLSSLLGVNIPLESRKKSISPNVGDPNWSTPTTGSLRGMVEPENTSRTLEVVEGRESEKLVKIYTSRKPYTYTGSIEILDEFNINRNQETKETKRALGSPGRKGKGFSSYGTFDSETNTAGNRSLMIDKINNKDIAKNTPNWVNSDLIKFRFEILTPNSPSYFLQFRAYLDSFSDDYGASIKGTRYLGRAEEFYTYEGFSRGINFSFKIAANSEIEMKPLYRKILYLASTTAPSYTTNDSFMRGVIVKATVGDYLCNIPGMIESVKYTWQQDYNWDISGKAYKDLQGNDVTRGELPQVLDCSISFKPIHNFIPRIAHEGESNKYVPFFADVEKWLSKEEVKGGEVELTTPTPLSTPPLDHIPPAVPFTGL